jgi:hypothetical protein
MRWVLGVLALAVLLAALYRYLLRVQARPVGLGHERPPVEPERPVRAPAILGDDPFFAEVDRFLRAAPRERPGSPPGDVRDAFSDLVELVHDRAAATRLVAFHGSIDAAIESVVRDRRP